MRPMREKSWFFTRTCHVSLFSGAQGSKRDSANQNLTRIMFNTKYGKEKGAQL